MEKITHDGKEVLTITRTDLEKLTVDMSDNEIRSNKLANEIKNKLEHKKHYSEKEIYSMEKQLVAYEYQAIKAKGFKECCEGFLWHFTGRVTNINENGMLIK